MTEIKRYPVGTKNKTLTTGPDGSLTIYVQADAPADPAQRSNWLPAPNNADFSLFSAPIGRRPRCSTAAGRRRQRRRRAAAQSADGRDIRYAGRSSILSAENDGAGPEARKPEWVMNPTTITLTM